MQPTPERQIDALASFAPVHYEDTFTCSIKRQEPITWDELGEALRKAMPWWAIALLGLRNVLVGWTGLKTGREGKAQGYGILDLFKTLEQDRDCVVLGEEDKHLDFRVVVRLTAGETEQTVSTTTLVQFHNRAGRAYFFCIKPFHKLIVGGMMRRTARLLR